MRSTALLILACVLSCHAATIRRIASGSTGGTDHSNTDWEADSGFTGGARWTTANQPGLATQDIPYNALRYAVMFSYSFTVPHGQYNLTLKFLEPNKTAIGQRVFGVTVNGVVAHAALDLFSVAPGALKPYDLIVPVNASTGTIQIALSAAVGNAVLSGIQIDSVDSPGTDWIPPTCRFADPPVNPQTGATCVFLDSAMFLSCTPGSSLQGMGQETCRWDGNQWLSTAAPSEAPMFPFASFTARSVQCTGGVVPFSKVNPATDLIELPLFTADGDWRWEHIVIAEVDTFTPAMDLVAAMGRPGTNDDEMTGAWVPLGVSSNYSNPWQARPSPPQVTGSYAVVLALHAGPGHLLQELSAGSVYYEACGYRVGPMATSGTNMQKVKGK